MEVVNIGQNARRSSSEYLPLIDCVDGAERVCGPLLLTNVDLVRGTSWSND